MIEGECILCFAPDLWSDIWRNRHRMLTILARKNRVLYVEPRNTLRSLIRRLRGGDLCWRDFLRRRVEEVRENLFVYHDPLHLPRVTRPGLGPFIDRLRGSRLRRVLRQLGFARPVLWLVRPDAWDLPGQFGEKAVLYQVVDDYLSYPGVRGESRARLDADERRLASHADVVIVTSQNLLEAKRHLHSGLHLVQNAVDDRTLEAGKTGRGPVPAELVAREAPIVGYVGGITGKIDLDLLEKVAGRLDAAGRGTLALVGPVRVSDPEDAVRVERLKSHARVVFTGKKEAEEVPSYLRAMQVCLVPYRLGSQSLAIDPLKLYEYLAFGKPVVSVDIPSVRPFAGVVRVARTHEEFLSLLGDAAREQDESLAARRRALAAENTWEARVETISRLLAEVLDRKDARRQPEREAAARSE